MCSPLNFARSTKPKPVTSFPATRTIPVVGVSRQPIRFRSVVLPLPEGPIKDTKEADDTIRGTSWTLIGLGVLDFIIGYFFLPSIILDGFVWIALALLVNKFRNKVTSIILVLEAM